MTAPQVFAAVALDNGCVGELLRDGSVRVRAPQEVTTDRFTLSAVEWLKLTRGVYGAQKRMEREEGKP